MRQEDYDVSLSEALALLPDTERIHTYLGSLIPLGAEWDRADVETLLYAAGGAWKVGGQMAALGHTLACRDYKGRVVYLETRGSQSP